MVGGKCGKKLQKQVAFDKTTCFCWSEMGDSNSRHLAPKASALPTALHPVMELFYLWSYMWSRPFLTNGFAEIAPASGTDVPISMASRVSE